MRADNFVIKLFSFTSAFGQSKRKNLGNVQQNSVAQLAMLADESVFVHLEVNLKPENSTAKSLETEKI